MSSSVVPSNDARTFAVEKVDARKKILQEKVAGYLQRAEELKKLSDKR